MHRCEYQIHDRNRGVRAELFRKHRLEPAAEKSFFYDRRSKARGRELKDRAKAAPPRQLLPRPRESDGGEHDERRRRHGERLRDRAPVSLPPDAIKRGVFLSVPTP